MKNLNVVSPYEVITSVNGSNKPTSYDALIITNQRVHYLPKGIGKYFQNISTLKVYNSGLKTIRKDNFRSLNKLTRLELPQNNLDKLDQDLFDHMSNLKNIIFDNNKLQSVGDGLLDRLSLDEASFKNNSCINEPSGDIFQEAEDILRLVSLFF